ncbi:MAG: DUF5024 domain-containing protein [Rikenellaceae bacterium]|nr:DUF5024 domain-containing protein [Rikenellaceae bacterium]
MKTILLIFATAAVLFITAAPVLSQQNLDKLMKICEKEPGVELAVVMDRDRETKELKMLVKTATIKNNKSLVDQFLHAFTLDKDQAFKIIETTKEGKTVPSLYSFAEGEKNVNYSLTYTDDSNATVSYIERQGKYSLIMKVLGDWEEGSWEDMLRNLPNGNISREKLDELRKNALQRADSLRSDGRRRALSIQHRYKFDSPLSADSQPE